MVIQDPNEKPTAASSARWPKPTEPPKSVKSTFALASPFDRLAAAVVDLFVVQGPIIYLVTAPFKRDLMAARMLQSEFDTIMAALGVAFVTLLTVVIYQTLCTWWLGATVGKLFFRLRVQKLWSGQKLTLLESLLRSVFWLVGFIPLGIPHLGAIANIKRRSLHDRLTDTIVVTAIPQNRVGPPSLMEAAFARGVLASFIVFSGLVGSAYLGQVYYELQSQKHRISFLEEEGHLCESVGQAEELWRSQGRKAPTRLEVAMTLYSAGLLDTDCLRAETKFVLEQDTESLLGNFAGSFATAEVAELSDLYLERVCDSAPESIECRMSEAIVEWSENRREKMQKILAELGEDSPIYMQVWAVQRSVQLGDFQRAKEFIGFLSPQEALSPFLASSRTQVFWGLRQESNATAAAEVAYESLNQEQRLDLSSWLCWQELGNSCQAYKTGNCKVFDENLPGTFKAINDLNWSLAYYKRQQCHKKGKTAFRRIAGKTSNKGVKRLLVALESLYDDGSAKKLRSLAFDDRAEHIVRQEAQRHLMSWSKVDSDFDKVFTDWQDNLPDLEWKKTGNQLLSKLAERKMYKESLKVSELLLQDDPEHKLARQNIVLSSYKLGREENAWKRVQKTREEELLRKPASSPEYPSILELLEKKFGGQ